MQTYLSRSYGEQKITRQDTALFSDREASLTTKPRPPVTRQPSRPALIGSQLWL